MTTIFLVSGTSWTVPSDWNNANNKVECIGGGASGGACAVASGSSAGAASGGGGGTYSSATNLVLTPGANVQVNIGAGGSAVSASGTNVQTTGIAGGDTWFNGTSAAASSVGAVGGSPGTGSGSGACTGGAGGGSGANAKAAGGRGGNGAGTATNNATGGGGAAGPNGGGNQGADVNGTGSAGGSGDAGAGGAGGAAQGVGQPGNAGSGGTEYDSSHGSGGGGSGGIVTAGNAGLYGAGGGGAICAAGSTATSGVGRQGLIRITYTPNPIVNFTATNLAPSSPALDTPTIITPDPNLVLLLHCDDANGATTFYDSSAKHHVITTNGAAQISTAQAKFGPSSGYFDGLATDFLSLDGSTDFAFGTGDFTIEFWMFNTSLTSAHTNIIYDGRDPANPTALTGFQLRVDTASTPVLLFTAGTTVLISGTTTIAVNTWYHVALVRASGVDKLFLNGVQEGGSYTEGNNYGITAGRPYIGLGTGGGGPMQGYLDEIRVSKGTARWTSNFTPPSAPYQPAALVATPLAPMPLAASQIEAGVTLLLHCDGANGSTSFIDSAGQSGVTNNNCTVSTAQAKFGGGSLNPNGGAANAFLSVTPYYNFEFAANNFTIDLWLWVGATTTSSYWVLSRAASPTYCPFLIYLNGSGQLQFYASSNGTSWDIASSVGGTTLPLSTWNHVAVVRNGNTITLYLNGQSIGTATSSAAIFASSNPLCIGATGNGGGGAGVQNYIDEVRVSRFARWTTNFTPPNAPQGTPAALGTPIINGTVADAPTVLLLHFDAALPLPFTDSSGKGHVVTPNGFARIWAQSGYFGGCGGYIDGNANSFLSLDGSADFAFGTGDFTIEFFVYCVTLPAANNPNLIFYEGRGNSSYAPLIYIQNSGYPSAAGPYNLAYYNATLGNLAATISIAANQWHHIAVARASGTARLFFDGTLVASGSDAGNLVTESNRPLLGAALNGLGNLYGFIDEVRVSKGIARYTAGFSIPTAPFATDANTVLLLHCDGPHTFVDSSPKNHSLTYRGNSQLAATTAKFGNSCVYFDAYETPGSSLALDGSTDFAFGTGDFTIEFWVMCIEITSGHNQVFYEGRSADPQTVPTIYMTGADGIVHYYVNGTEPIHAVSGLTQYNFYHFAFTRAAGTLRMFINGVLEASSSDSTNYTVNAGTPYIGDYITAGGSPTRGFMDEVRVSKGIARWTANFTPFTGPYGGYALTANSLAPASPVLGLAQPLPAIDPNCVLLLHFDGAMSSTSFPDTSGRNHTVTPNGSSFITTNQSVFGGASGSFNGAANTYLTLDGGGDFAFGTGDFTIDFWFMPNAFPAAGNPNWCIYDGRIAGDTTTPTPIISINNGSPFLVFSDNVTVSNGSTILAANTWYHCALTRASGTLRLFLNGALEIGPVANTVNYAIDANRPMIGANANQLPANAYFVGWLDELEVLRGKARWTANFGPPTQPYRHLFSTPTTLATASPALDMPVAGSGTAALDLVSGSPTFGTPALRAFFGLVAADLVTASPFLGLAAWVGQLFATDLAPLPPDLGVPLLGQLHHLFADTLSPLLPTSSTPEFGQPTRLPQPPPTYPAGMDRHVRRDGSDYAQALIDLLPRGQAWPRDPGTTLIQALTGLADYYGFVDGRAADLLERESDPRSTLELLPDWERNWGLPDPCFKEAKTIGERQNVLVMKMTLPGGQSRQFFYGVAAYLGYQIRITEYSPFMAGVSQVGDTTWLYDGIHPRWQIGPPEMRYYWTIDVGQASLTWFRASKGQAGVDPHLKIGIADDLECLFNRWKPAHTQIVFSYDYLTTGGPMAGTP